MHGDATMIKPANKPARSKAETKADITDRTARAIIDDESGVREAKTEKLRRARLEREAREASAPLASEARKAKRSASRHKSSSSHAG